MPTIRLLFFAAARELLGGLSEAEADIPGSTVADVRTYLAQAYPALGPVVGTVTLALNLQYVPQAAEGRMEVKDGDEARMATGADQAVGVDREAAIAGLKAKATLRGLLKSTLRVTLSDGRVVTGQYQCMDEHLNLILQHATERRTVQERAGGEGTVARQQTRELGLVMCPGEHVVKVDVKERDPLEVPRG